MQNAIISIFCHVDDFLKAISWNDESQCRMTLAEVITVGLISWRFFQGNLELARIFLHEHGYIPNILSKSRLNRRLHDIPSFFWHLIVAHLSHQVEPCLIAFLFLYAIMFALVDVHFSRTKNTLVITLANRLGLRDLKFMF